MAAAYAVVAWVLVEVSSVVLPALLLPDWTVRLVVVVALAGFPLTLLLSWLFDLTDGGIVRTTPSAGGSPRTAWAARGLFLAVFVATVAGVMALWPWEGERAQRAPENSIAVLPFDNFSDDPGDSYFSDGISEELLNSLVGVEGLHVAARTSSFAFRDRAINVREIGQELNVAKVLEGSVRRQGNRVRITAQLINVEDGYHIWSRTFESPLDDIFAVQDQISRAIVEQLKLTLIGEVPRQAATANVRAYDLYLLGRHHWHARTRESLERSLELFQQAVDLDRDFALAYTGIADAYLLLGSYGHLASDEGRVGAEPAIARALELDSGLPEAYASLGLLRLNLGELTAAELALRKAIQLNPNFSMAHMWLGLVLRQTGTLYEAREAFSRARELDPLHPIVNHNVASNLAAMGEYAAARALLQDFAQKSADPPKAYLAIADIATQFGRYDEAVQAARNALELAPENGDASAALARAYASMGAFDEAQRWAGRLADSRSGEYYGLMVLPYVDYLRGDVDAMRAHARDAAERAPKAKAEPLLRFWTGLALLHEEDYAAGAVELEAALAHLKGIEVSPAETLGLHPVLAHAYRQIGQEQRAIDLLEDGLRLAERARTAGWATPQLTASLAGIQAGLGRNDEAARTLQQAVDEGWRDYWYAVQTPGLGHSTTSTQVEALLRDVREELARMRSRVLAQEAQRTA